MKRLTLLMCLNMIAFGAIAQDSNPETIKPPVSVASQQNIEISSKGHDVRVVLHDLFTQVKKNYVLEGVGRSDLFLSLNAVDFDETLEIICRLANLKYELQNGIYYITKNRAITPTKVPNSESSATVSAITGPVSTSPNSTKPVSNAKPTGKLPQSVLKRTVKGTYQKMDLRDIIADLGQKSEVKILVSDAIPKYKLDFALNTTSLGFALKSLSQTLKLKITFTNEGTILLEPAGKK